MRAILALLAIASAASAGNYYVDCGSGSDAASGATPETAWKTLARVSATTFAPGDTILLRRGARCAGSLSPRGSGEENRPIRLGAYGKGALPVIEAGAAEAAITLSNQQYWEIENLETTGGNHYGIHVSGPKPDTPRTLRHIHLRNLVVHDVTGAVKEKASGLVVIAAPDGVTFEDVLVDGVTAFNTTQWAGILITGSRNRVRGAVVRNSIVHHVFGDGIVMFLVENGTIQRSAAWLTGLQPTQTIGTPNGIWTWSCRNCTVESTEGFWIDSPGVDGGVYDIDWGNDDNTVQYNYGHDAQGYCAAVFGAGKLTTTNSVIRYNVCVNNGRSPKLARRQGDLYTSTWDGGSLDGVLIEHNTFVWNPPIDAPAIQMSGTEFTGARPNRVAGNIVYSSVPALIDAVDKVKFERNVYWYAGRESPNWTYGGLKVAGESAWHSVAPQDRVTDPKLDWLLHPLETLAGIGAVPPSRPPARSQKAPASLQQPKGKWMLLLFPGEAEPDARSQLVFLQTALAQYRNRGLEAGVVTASNGDLPYDWDFGSIRPVQAGELERELGVRKAPALLLLAPTGEIVRRWDGFAGPSELGLTLKHFLGPGPGNPALPGVDKP